MVSCHVKLLTGIECPGCGMQRAFIELLRGHFSQSFLLNPGAMAFIVTFVYCMFHITVKFNNGARNVVILFILTVSLMIVNFVVKLSC
jgi:hypothetical protein